MQKGGPQTLFSSSIWKAGPAASAFVSQHNPALPASDAIVLQPEPCGVQPHALIAPLGPVCVAQFCGRWPDDSRSDLCWPPTGGSGHDSLKPGRVFRFRSSGSAGQVQRAAFDCTPSSFGRRRSVLCALVLPRSAVRTIANRSPGGLRLRDWVRQAGPRQVPRCLLAAARR